jgi:hypothetical protein
MVIDIGGDATGNVGCGRIVERPKFQSPVLPFHQPKFHACVRRTGSTRSIHRCIHPARNGTHSCWHSLWLAVHVENRTLPGLRKTGVAPCCDLPALRMPTGVAGMKLTAVFPSRAEASMAISFIVLLGGYLRAQPPVFGIC